jgi:hypothetical protein
MTTNNNGGAVRSFLFLTLTHIIISGSLLPFPCVLCLFHSKVKESEAVVMK